MKIWKIRNLNQAIFKLILLILLLISDACTSQVGRMFPNRPTRSFKKELKNASPDFKQGWNDGCNVGMTAGSNTFYKSFYSSNQVDGYKITNSPEYSTAYNNAFWFCYRTDYIKQKSTIWGSFFKGHI